MIKSWKVEELVSIIKRSDNPTEIADSVSQLVDLAQEEGLSVKDYVQTALVLQSTQTKFQIMFVFQMIVEFIYMLYSISYKFERRPIWKSYMD